MLNAWKYVTVISWREVTPNALSIVKKNAEKVPDNDSNWISRTEPHWFKPPKCCHGLHLQQFGWYPPKGYSFSWTIFCK